MPKQTGRGATKGVAREGTKKGVAKESGAKVPPPPLRREEPTLKDCWWGPRPAGAYNNEAAERFATQVTKSPESIYVGPKGVEFDGYRAADRMLLDAKFASDYGFYDIGSQKFYIYDPSKKVPFQVDRILGEAARQIGALEKSGAAGIQWILNHKRIAEDLARLFARNGVNITVVGPKGAIRLKT